MSTPPLPKVAGINPALSGVPQTPRSPHTSPDDSTRPGRPRPRGLPHSGVSDRLARWASELGTLHDLTERLSRTTTLTDAVRETLRAGAGLLGARRALFSLRPVDGLGPERLIGLGLSHAELGQLDTVPQAYGEQAVQQETLHPDIARDERLHPRHREVAACLGCAASYAVPLTTHLTTPPAGHLGMAVWLYDRPAAPDPHRRRLLARYLRPAAQHLATRLELTRADTAARAVREGLLPSRLAPLPGAALAVRHHQAAQPALAPRTPVSCDFYDALTLPEGALGLAIGSTTGPGPAALAAAGSLRAGLRAYAVMEGEDPVAVLSDLELLLRLTEPDRAATALFCYAEPPPAPDRPTRHLVLASAGHPPPLVVGPARAAFAETALSAPLGMLACWEAPSAHLEIAQGETVLLYTTALLRATGEPLDAAFARLESAARAATPAARADPGALADHIAEAVLATGPPPEDVVLLAARFQ
jgi:serine phosphatase RsbU (regulator of sigma subunit)